MIITPLGSRQSSSNRVRVRAAVAGFASEQQRVSQKSRKIEFSVTGDKMHFEAVK